VTDAPVLAAERLAVSIRGMELVSRVDVEVGAGQCLAIAGESGSGKTVTCRSFVGLLGRLGGEVSGGRLLLGGEDVSRDDERAWRSRRGRAVALVPQASLASLNPVVRVGSQMVETIRALGGARAARGRALELLEQVRLDDPERVFRSYPHQLSGGMRQRVMIALSIAGRPRLLVADEPTTALDVTVQRQILALLRDLQRASGMALVFVTHDLSVVREIADRVAVMYAGETIETGPVADVLQRPLHPYTRALLAADPTTAPRGRPLSEVPGKPADPRSWPAGCRFQPRCEHAREECAAPAPLRSFGGSRAAACHRVEQIGEGR